MSTRFAVLKRSNGKVQKHLLASTASTSATRKSSITTGRTLSRTITCISHRVNPKSLAGNIRLLSRSSTTTTAQSSSLSLLDRYKELLQQQEIEPDEHQMQALQKLESLRQQILAPVQTNSTQTATTNTQNQSSFFPSFWPNSRTSSNKIFSPSIQGIYIHGGVGCGKTFVMKLFIDSLLQEAPSSILVHVHHFHAFMLHIHQQLHIHRKKNDRHSSKDSILSQVVEDLFSNASTANPNYVILCLDEFQVTDVADAMILQQLFQELWRSRQAILVATSNRAPDMLYWNGLQRDRFLPFIELLKQHCTIVNMDESTVDYRIVQKANNTKNSNSSENKVFFVGNTGKYDFQQLFYQLVGPSTAVAPTTLETQGRKVYIPQASLKKGIAKFTFEEICQKALGAADYIVIGQHFHTVFVSSIPTMNLLHINWIRRFITFIDAMYEHHVKVILHTKTASSIHEIVQSSDSSSAENHDIATSKLHHDEIFAFDRTKSRLEEMSSSKYLQRMHEWNKKSNKAELLSKRQAKLELSPSWSDTRRSQGY